MTWRVVGNKNTGFKVQYKRNNLWCYVTTKGRDGRPYIREFTTKAEAERYDKFLEVHYEI